MKFPKGFYQTNNANDRIKIYHIVLDLSIECARFSAPRLCRGFSDVRNSAKIRESGPLLLSKWAMDPFSKKK